MQDAVDAFTRQSGAVQAGFERLTQQSQALQTNARQLASGHPTLPTLEKLSQQLAEATTAADAARRAAVDAYTQAITSFDAAAKKAAG